MPTLAQKVHDLAYRCARLGRYCGAAARPTVMKHRGRVFLIPEAGQIWVVVPEKGTSYAWWHEDQILDQEGTFALLQSFDHNLEAVAMVRAREEAIEILARRILARVTKPKTRGFKADLKRKSRPKNPADSV